MVGLSATIVPEFVSGIVLILIFGVWLRLVADLGDLAQRIAGLFTQVYYLLLPSLPLVLVLFGYIARMARAGTIEALDADYTRTAILKGLPLAHGDLAPRAAQCAAADHQRDRHPDRSI